jgi:hypothetical protein
MLGQWWDEETRDGMETNCSVKILSQKMALGENKQSEFLTTLTKKMQSTHTHTEIKRNPPNSRRIVSFVNELACCKLN